MPQKQVVRNGTPKRGHGKLGILQRCTAAACGLEMHKRHGQKVRPLRTCFSSGGAESAPHPMALMGTILLPRDLAVLLPT
jgi:hypothetical protein